MNDWLFGWNIWHYQIVPQIFETTCNVWTSFRNIWLHCRCIFWVCLIYIRNKWTHVLHFWFKQPFDMMSFTGVIIETTAILGEKLGLTNRKQSYPPTGTHLSLRSVSVWRSNSSSGSLSSTSRPALCTHWSQRITPPPCSSNVTGNGSMLFVSGASSARIGFVSNDANDCYACDLRIGFGTARYPDDMNACGYAAWWCGDNGDKFIKAGKAAMTSGVVLQIFSTQAFPWNKAKDDNNKSEYSTNYLVTAMFVFNSKIKNNNQQTKAKQQQKQKFAIQ